MLLKRGILKSFPKFTDKHKKQLSGGVLWKDVLQNFGKFTEKASFPESHFNKVAVWKPKTSKAATRDVL